MLRKAGILHRHVINDEGKRVWKVQDEEFASLAAVANTYLKKD